MKDYFRKHGIRVLLIVVAAVLIIGLSAAARGNRIGFVQNFRGTLSAPLQKVRQTGLIRSTAISMTTTR